MSSYQGLNILYEKNTTSGVTTKHFYANGLQVAKMVGVTTYYLHQDALGSTRLVNHRRRARRTPAHPAHNRDLRPSYTILCAFCAWQPRKV